MRKNRIITLLIALMLFVVSLALCSCGKGAEKNAEVPADEYIKEIQVPEDLVGADSAVLEKDTAKTEESNVIKVEPGKDTPKNDQSDTTISTNGPASTNDEQTNEQELTEEEKLQKFIDMMSRVQTPDRPDTERNDLKIEPDSKPADTENTTPATETAEFVDTAALTPTEEWTMAVM